MMKLIKSILLNRRYTISRKGLASDDHFNGFAAPVPNPRFTIALIGTSQAGFSGIGKASQLLYFPKFGYRLAKQDVLLVWYTDYAEALLHIDRHDPDRTAFIFIYNETFQRECMQSLLEITSQTGFVFYNAPKLGEIIGDKIATNTLYESNRIRTPKIVADHAGIRVLSNARIGSNAAIDVVEIGEPLDANRYNTAFIDTTHSYKGQSYYVALRALTVSGTIISAYVRLRPAAEANPSVHAKDTPRDPDLIKYFHEKLVEANRKRLTSLCKRLGSALGRGFFVHDILPNKENGELYVCETGFKFDDMAYREWLWPISSDLPFLSDHFTLAIADLAADAIVQECLGKANG